MTTSIDEIVGMFAKAPEDMTTSMLTDREARRPLEWDIRNGVISRKAAGHGLATPISDVPGAAAGGGERRPRLDTMLLACMAMQPCERVGLEFIDTAPFRFVSTVDLAITPEQLFEVLADAESWPHWATAITKVTWTSPEPRGVGTTRIVNMRGGIIGDEEFLAWEPFTHMAFRFNEALERAASRRSPRTIGSCRRPAAAI